MKTTKDLKIQAFGRTAKEDTGTEGSRSASELRETAAKLKKAGFHAEAKDYAIRATHLEKAEIKKKRRSVDACYRLAENRKSMEQRKEFAIGRAILNAKIAKIPHISEVKEHRVDVKLTPSKIDSSELLPASIQHRLKTDRNAAWEHYKTGGV